MQFEWNESKRRENIERRGVDFIRAAMVFADPDRLEAPDSREDYGEARMMTVVPWTMKSMWWSIRCAVTSTASSRPGR